MAPQHKQIFVFDMSRNRSHLFFRYLGTHPDIQELWHPILPAFIFGPDRITQYTRNVTLDGKVTEWAPAIGTETMADAHRKIWDAAKVAEEQNKILVIKEHSQMTYKQDIVLALLRNESMTFPKSSNPTTIPDPIFNTLIPVFVIRHPVFATPSNYISFQQTSNLRPGGEDWRAVTGVPLQRRLFDHFRDRNNGTPPLVVDGDDVVWRTDEVGEKLSQGLGLSPNGLSSVWSPVPEDKRSDNEIIRHFLREVDNSNGILLSSEQRPAVDLDKAYRAWIERFGQEVASQLRATAEENMPHYAYMAQFKL